MGTITTGEKKVKGQRYTKQQFLDAIPGSCGLITRVAEAVGCHYQTAQRWLKRPGISPTFDAECNRIHDMAVAVVIEAIESNDVASAKWWLSRRRRVEYGDGLDITSGGGPITLRVVYDS